MINLKKLLSAGLCMALLLTASACGKDTAAPGAVTTAPESDADDSIDIGISFDSFVIERWITDRNVFVSTAEGLGANVNVQSANGSVQSQIEQIRYLINQKVDVIVVIPVDCESLSDVIAEAQSAGIRVISYDRLAENSDVDLYISFDNYMVGNLMGEAMKTALPEGGQVFMICGPLTDTNAPQVELGFRDAIKGTDLDVVYEYRCSNWNAALGYNAVKQGLDTYPDVKAIMCGNDDIATYAFTALSENRLAGKVLLTGQDGDLMACQRIVQGTQLVTAFKSVAQEATAAAEYAVRLANGESIDDIRANIVSGSYSVPYLQLRPTAVTSENMEEVIVDGGYHTHAEVYLAQ